ncbi:MAG: bifunctional DNA primase/polymerase [Acidimicrobiia bacterium]|nr:bifunctional DNA primase/polymerase [Acidimicrobiia bacterium]MDH5290660.1 bifunctional DNA primase/polymerase [Acidimicrobiia bacterium]
MNELVRAALDALDRGWSVVPLHDVTAGACSCGDPDCPAPGKHPRVAWLTFQHRRPTARTVRRWWQRWPGANVGAVTGEISGIAVLDVDPRNGGVASLEALERAWGVLGPVVESLTGGGGRHVYFAHPGRPLSTGPLAPGLDLKGEGGLVVVPPSRHASGQQYRWRDGADPASRPLSAMPWWILHHHPEPAARTGPTASRPTAQRTAAEQREFAEAWAECGLNLQSGDRMYRCPFHPDRHPSLHIDAAGCRWHCFGCGRGGGTGQLHRLLGDERPPRLLAQLREHYVGPVTPTMPEGGVVEVVGESRYQDDLLRLTGGRRHYGGVRVSTIAQLVPEGDNRHDAGAVAVRINGLIVGHLGRLDARRLRPLIDRIRAEHGQATCWAEIVGGWDRGAGDVGYFGVRLELGPDSHGSDPDDPGPG